MKIVKPAALALLLAMLLAATEYQTRDVIRANQSTYAERVLREMAGTAELIRTDEGYDIRREGQLTGRILSTSTTEGYNGEIALLVAVTSGNEIISVRTTYHRETPGIGDKIDREISDWIDGFRGRSLNNTNWAVKPTGDIDAITGATITARATINAVHGVLTP